MMKIWQSLALKDRIKIFIVCIILPLIFLGILIYEGIPEYKKNPAEVQAMILMLSISVAIFIYFWRRYHSEIPEVKSRKEIIEILK